MANLKTRLNQIEKRAGLEDDIWAKLVLRVGRLAYGFCELPLKEEHKLTANEWRFYKQRTLEMAELRGEKEKEQEKLERMEVDIRKIDGFLLQAKPN